MSDLSRENPLGRFTGLASGYARHRPGYPDSVLSYLTRRTGLCRGAQVVDVGSGSGISSRWLCEAGFEVIGVEPNDEMRAKAESESRENLIYQSGTAEATGLPDGCCDLVVAAQAFHWFDPVPTFREFTRILRDGGFVALIWNERDESDAFTHAVGEVIRTAPDALRVESARMSASQSLHESELFEESETTHYSHEQIVDEEGLIGRVLSASYVPREGEAKDIFVEKLRRIYSEHQTNGIVTIHYQTTMHLARRA